MTGKELIIYILMNDLEDKPIFQNGRFLGFITVPEAAVKFKVGENTVKAWYKLGFIKGVEIGDEIYISANTCPPKEVADEEVFANAIASFINKC